jgi:hypothetical protein
VSLDTCRFESVLVLLLDLFKVGLPGVYKNRCMVRSCTFLLCEIKHSTVVQSTSRKIAGSIPDEVIDFFQFTKFFQSRYGPGVDSASNRNEYHEDSWG